MVGVSPAALLLPLALGAGVWLYREFRGPHGPAPPLPPPSGTVARGHSPRPARRCLVCAGRHADGDHTSYSKLGASIEALFAPGHVESLAYFSLQPLNYTSPFSDQAIQGGPGPQLDAIAAIQYPLILGIVAAPWSRRCGWGNGGRQWRLRAASCCPHSAAACCSVGRAHGAGVQCLAPVGRRAGFSPCRACCSWPVCCPAPGSAPACSRVSWYVNPMTQTIDIDIRGQLCPSCLLLTLKELNRHGTAVRAGSTEIVVTTDDRQATATSRDSQPHGFCTEVARLDGSYRIRVFGGA